MRFLSDSTSSYDWPDYIKIVRSKRARRLALRLDSKERVVRLTIPAGVSMRKAQDFAEEHDRWIVEQLDALPSTTPFVHGAEIPVLGQLRRVEIMVDESVKRTSIALDGKILRVKTNKDDPSARITRFLKKLSKETLAQLSEEKAARIDKVIFSITVRDTKTRWGSCTEDGALSYSWRLIFAPYDAMDYVVAHEVAHLEHMDHSKRFWGLCTTLSDDYVEGKYWMRNHGKELMAFG